MRRIPLIAGILLLLSVVSALAFNGRLMLSLCGKKTCKDAKPILIATPANVTFANTTSNGQYRRATVTVQNTGTGPATSITHTMATGAPFRNFSSTCSTLSPGATCRYQIEFAPTTPGAVTDTSHTVSNQLPDVEVALSGTGVAGGSACTNGLALWLNFEDGTNPSTATCTTGTDTTASLTGGSSINSTGTYVSSGTYSVNAVGEDDAVEIDSAGLAAGLATTGTWCGDYYHSATGSGYAYTLNSLIAGRFTDGAGANDTVLLTVYGTDSYTGTTTVADSTMTRICYSWDATQAAGADRLCNKVGSNSWQCKTNATLTDQTLATTMFIVNGNFQFGRGYVDNIKLYSTYQAE